MRKYIFLACFISTASLAGGTYVHIPAGEFTSVLKYEDNKGKQKMAAYEMMKQPVTNAEFLAFVKKNPQWQRGKTPNIFAEPKHYLSHWQTQLVLGAKVKLQQPVTQVSWFAASAYCEAQNARLPTWNEWEYTAAADAKRRDARSDPAWRESILSWYSKPSNTPIADVGKTPANVYGVQDLNGLVWEWTEDYSAMLVSADNRNQSDPDKSKFCGASALSMEDKENYAVMMRVAMLSSLEAVNSTSNLGFRCARTLP
jgi:formylglycine-generating enzyme required for sulfatase activity